VPVTRIGSVGSIQSSADSGSQAITVPSDAEIIIVSVGGYHGTASRFSGGTLTLNGVSLTVGRADDTSASLAMSAMFYLLNPATGSQSLAWNWAGTTAMIIGAQVYYSFYKGINKGNPIRDSQGIQSTGSTSVNRTVANTKAGDMICAYSHMEQNNPNYPTAIGWANATEVREDAYNKSNNAYAENSDGVDVTITATGTGGSGSSYYYNLSILTLAMPAMQGMLLGDLKLGHNVLGNRGLSK
jgi:hypothetical protein